MRKAFAPACTMSIAARGPDAHATQNCESNKTLLDCAKVVVLANVPWLLRGFVVMFQAMARETIVAVLQASHFQI
jgi:hypothetical protein